ncbi:MAG: hypothetical protein HUJ67_07665 [Ruminiclostridium sp.]|nr:hypothetical protein [Ruminiclostridium sp.]
MARLIILFTLLLPVAVLFFTRKRPLGQSALWLIGTQAALSALYCVTNGISAGDFLRGDGHGTVVLLFIYASDLVAAAGLLVRFLWALWRRREEQTR